MHILLIEDDRELGPLIADNLRRDGFAVDLAPTIAEGLEIARLVRFDAAVIDRRLPDGEGLNAIPRLRAHLPGLPVLVLTARDAIDDRVDGLNGGADDYLGKPFAQAELVARLRSLLRRPRDSLITRLTVGNLSFDPATQEVQIAGQPITLARRELALIETLCRRPGRVVTRDSAIAALYGLDEPVADNALEAAVSRLRKRLGEAGASVDIQTVRGVGYLLREAGR